MSGSMRPRFSLLRQAAVIPSSVDSSADPSLHRWLFFVRTQAELADTLSESAYRRSAKLARLEAVLLIAEGPLSARRLAQLATLADAAEARSLIQQLTIALDRVGCSFRIERVGTGYQMMTRPEFVFWLDRLHHRQSHLKLSSPAMESLAIVAYRQPVTRADIEVIRGVQCTEMLKQLMERGLVRIAGHEESLGRPYLYGTTPKFLELFGLKNLDEMPAADRLRRAPDRPASPPPPVDAAESVADVEPQGSVEDDEQQAVEKEEADAEEAA